MREGVKFKFILILAFLAQLSACANSVFFPSDTPAQLGNDASAIAFSETLFPILEANCSSCHGVDQAPLFALSNDPQTSHDNLLPETGTFIRFDDPRSSPLALKVFRAHNCWTSSCSDDGQAIVDAITLWKERRGVVSSQITGVATATLVIPSDLEPPRIVGGRPVSVLRTMTFDLSGLNGGLVGSGSRLEIEIEQFDEDHYLISYPTVFSNDDLYIQNVKVYVNEQKVDAAAWELIDLTANSNPTTGVNIGAGLADSVLANVGFGLPETEPQGPGVDTLTFSFEYIGPPADPQQVRFAAVQNIIRNECASCHGGARNVTYLGASVPAFGDIGNEAGFLGLSYGSNPANGGAPQTLVVPGNAAASSLFQSVAHGVNGTYPGYGAGLRTMPTNNPSNAERISWSNTIADWINNIP